MIEEEYLDMAMRIKYLLDLLRRVTEAEYVIPPCTSGGWLVHGELMREIIGVLETDK